MVDWGGIYEVIYLCESDTDMANAFRIAVGMPPVRRRRRRIGARRGGLPGGGPLHRG
ncbi:MAG: hypothetical protein IKE20_03190 [Eggerthellaceae bacterium]|nr:hypothetical protein [Eggerthellaceae bacterium]MBR2837789.1 hypothetical protein [Kiritimatiellia bacterium]